MTDRKKRTHITKRAKAGKGAAKSGQFHATAGDAGIGRKRARSARAFLGCLRKYAKGKNHNWHSIQKKAHEEWGRTAMES